VELLDSRVKLKNPLIVAITTDLLHFLIKHAVLFDQRLADGRVIDAHGDLRPEHICLGPSPVFIDRIEFNSELRVMDIAEELSTLALECDILESPPTGQLFLNVYRWKSQDKIPDMLIQFYKAKRALLRAKLSISHLSEEKYLTEETKWRGRCEAYLKAADAYCEHLPKKG
jgi:aminoglycoside phosphotransferase family enzyme